MAQGGVKFVIVAVDYFTKWVKAEPLTIITLTNIISFVIRNIICRNVVPMKIISDNGTQFKIAKFAEFYS